MTDPSFYLLLTAIFLANTIYGLASPFLPTVLDNKDVSSIWTGIIFASYAFAATIVSILTGKILEKAGHKNVITIGAFLMCAAIVSFGFVDDIDDKTLLISICVLLRICQGTAAGMINTSCYSFVSTAFPDNIESLISIMESFVGVGCTMGPVLGSFIYSSLGFGATFWVFGGLMGPVAIMNLLTLPKPT